MFMFMHSAAAQLAAKLAPRPSEHMPVELADTTQPYDPQLCEGLIMRLHASKAQNRTVFSHVRVAGRDVLRNAKKLWIKAMPSPAPPQVVISENFDIPHIFITEETKTPFNPIRRRARVRPIRCPDSPSSTYCLYSPDSDDERYEADHPASMFSDNSSNLDTIAAADEYQDLYDILEESEYEWEPEDTEYYATLEVEEEADDVLSDPGTENDSASGISPEAGDDDNISEPSCLEAHCGDGPSFTFAPDAGSPWTTSTPTSVFCPPTPVSALGPSTPSDGESGPSTSFYTPVLMHESISYEEALFLEFKAIVDEAAINDDAPPRM